MDEGSVTNMPPDDGRNLYQPDQVITPSAAPAAPAASLAPAQTAEAAPVVPQSAVPEQPAPSLPGDAAPAPGPVIETEAASAPVPEQVLPDDGAAITWTASEYIASQKSSNWYLMLAVAAIVVGALVWLLTRDFFPTAAVLIGVILLGVYAGRQPRQETYTIDGQGLTVGSRQFGYHEFRSFALVPDGAFMSIQFTPLKRFATDTTIYVDPADEDRIINRLSQYLPMEEAKPSLTDNVMRRIKF